ncbi:MAG: hypothetical protein IT320_05425 [Anaerolineae bacterium]|nr:hypothetical protein [Anaerolineae bacterium]
MATREQNERAFPNWDDLPDGGRRYWRERPGGDFGKCRYIKIVAADEATLSFVQEIYDDEGVLIEVHQKYPIDTGHQYLASERDDTPDDSPEAE